MALSELQKKYRAYFKEMLKKYGVKSPANIKPITKKKSFFNNIKKFWNNGQGPKAEWQEKVKITEATEIKKVIRVKQRKIIEESVIKELKRKKMIHIKQKLRKMTKEQKLRKIIREEYRRLLKESSNDFSLIFNRRVEKDFKNILSKEDYRTVGMLISALDDKITDKQLTRADNELNINAVNNVDTAIAYLYDYAEIVDPRIYDKLTTIFSKYEDEY